MPTRLHPPWQQVLARCGTSSKHYVYTSPQQVLHCASMSPRLRNSYEFTKDTTMPNGCSSFLAPVLEFVDDDGDDPRLTAVFQDNQDKPAPECLHSGFYWKGGGDNWSYMTCKAAAKLSPPTNQHPAFYRPDALPVTQQTVSEQ